MQTTANLIMNGDGDNIQPNLVGVFEHSGDTGRVVVTKNHAHVNISESQNVIHSLC